MGRVSFATRGVPHMSFSLGVVEASPLVTISTCFTTAARLEGSMVEPDMF